MNKNVAAIGAAVLIGVVVMVILMRGAKTHVDERFAARLQDHMKELGLEPVPSATAFAEDGALSVYAITPAIDDKLYVIEVLYAPGTIACWARLHEKRWPVYPPQSAEIATSKYEEETGQTAYTRKNCPEAAYEKLTGYFDGIKNAVNKTINGG